MEDEEGALAGSGTVGGDRTSATGDGTSKYWSAVSLLLS